MFRPMISAATTHAMPSSRAEMAKTLHFPFVGSEPNQRDHGERQLYTENDLAENEQLGGAALAVPGRDHHRRHDGQQTRDTPAQPARQSEPKEAFHDDLTGQGGGDGGVLPGGQERHGEQRARQRRPQQRREQHIRLLDLRNLRAPVRMKDGCGDDQNGGIDQQRQHESDGESIVANTMACRLPAVVNSKRRVCTTAECR